MRLHASKSPMPSRSAAAARLTLTLKRGYVAAVRAVSARVHVPDPGGVSLQGGGRWRHWLASLARIHDVNGMIELEVPWWTYQSISHIDRWLSLRPKPVRIFEYGSGASTLWLASRADTVVSVEHDEQFAAMMRPVLAPHHNVILECCPAVPSSHPTAPSRKPGYQGLDFARYVDTIESYGGPFDLIVIDGRAREVCLDAATQHLAADGIIVFDNSHRGRYRRSIEASPLTEMVFRGLTPALPYPEQTSVLFRPSSE